MRNAEYWAKRMEAIENMSHDAGIEYARNVEEQFRKAEIAINAKIDAWYGRLAKNNGISLAEAKKLLRADELEEFHWTVEEYIEKGKTLQYSDQWAKALENASSKVHISRLEAIKLQMQQECEVLYGNLADGLDSTLKSIYTQGYYHTAFEVQKGVGVGWGFNKLDRNKIEKAVHTCWANDGKRFSDRCWANKEKLVRELNTTLTQSIIRGEDPRKAIEQLGKRMGVAKSTAGRLIMTESAAISSMSQKDCFNELGVEEFEFIATLDSHTSEICRSMDGMHFKMSDYQIGVNAPPLHCWCRSCTAPYFDDEFAVGERAARGEDGKTYYVPADTTYKEWKSAFVDGDCVEDFTPIEPENKEYIDKFESIVGRKPNVDEMSYTDADLDMYFLTGTFPENVKNTTVKFSEMSLSELKQYAKTNLATPFSGFDGVKLQYAQEAVETIQKFEEKMDGTIEGLKVEFGNVRDNAFAHYDKKTKTLYLKKHGNLEERQIADNERALKKLGNVQHATTTYSGTIWHELGHAIDDDTGESLSRIISEDKELLNKSFKISNYASANPAIGSPRASEAFAENFAAYMDGGANAKDVPEEIVLRIEGYFSNKRIENKTYANNSAMDRLGFITNNNKSNPRYYDYEGKTIDIVEQEICKNDYETAVCFDKNGKAIFAQVQKGDDYEIRFTKYQMRRMKGNDVTHNHPLSTPPSPEDVNVLRKNKANSIRTTGRNGTYVLEYSDIEKLPDYDELSNVYDEILAELQPKYIEMIKNGMEEKNAIVKLGDEIWEKLYDIYGVKPKFIRR